jgi:hypothetical protein
VLDWLHGKVISAEQGRMANPFSTIFL